jgi:hypothetical protein
MSATTSALILSWIVLLVLTSAFAGLVIRFAELRRDVEVALGLRANALDSEEMTGAGIALAADSHQTLTNALDLGRTPFVLLAVDVNCAACHQALADLDELAAHLPSHRVLALAEDPAHLSGIERYAPRMERLADEKAWVAVPGIRPVIVVGSPADARFLPITHREELLRLLAPHLDLFLEIAERPSQ